VRANAVTSPFLFVVVEQDDGTMKVADGVSFVMFRVGTILALPLVEIGMSALPESRMGPAVEFLGLVKACCLGEVT